MVQEESTRFQVSTQDRLLRIPRLSYTLDCDIKKRRKKIKSLLHEMTINIPEESW